jgi:hypothetical protein
MFCFYSCVYLNFRCNKMEFETRNTKISNDELRHARNAIEYDVYILLCILTSSKFLHKNDRKFYGLFFQLMDFEKSEIYRIIFSISLRVRNFIEKNKIINSLHLVGNLIENNGLKQPLTLREACNKIIHSEHINFDLINPKSDYNHNGVKEIIYVYGRKGKIEWKASISLFQFVDTSMQTLLA